MVVALYSEDDFFSVRYKIPADRSYNTATKAYCLLGTRLRLRSAHEATRPHPPQRFWAISLHVYNYERRALHLRVSTDKFAIFLSSSSLSFYPQENRYRCRDREILDIHIFHH